jgi:hypothetical protein
MHARVALGAWIAVFAMSGPLSAHSFNHTKDDVAIVMVDPAAPVPRGTETTFVVDVQYTLDSADEGTLTVGFNMANPSNNPMGYVIVETRLIKRGTDRIKVKAKAVPVAWSKDGGFEVSVEIGPKREDDRWKPLAVDFREIPTFGTGEPIVPGVKAHDRPAAVAGAPSKDDVTIRIVEPTVPAVRGVETEFTFDIDYTLDSVDEGTLSIAFNTAGPIDDKIVEMRPITRGSGRIRIKRKAVPVDWGERGTFHASVILGPKLDGTTTSWNSMVRKIIEIPTAP